MISTHPSENHPIDTGPDHDKFGEDCGVFGIHGFSDAAAHTVLGLHALQHRGQEAAGVVAFDGRQFTAHRDLGLVGDIFSSTSIMARLQGRSAIGHVRYSTIGESALRNVQPLFADLQFGGFALAHNGNLTNAVALRQGLVSRGALFHSTSDTEVIIHLMAVSAQDSVVNRMADALRQVEGAYSLVALADSCVIGVRDPLCVRPLVIGRLGQAHIIASETCALDIIGAELVREVDAGEMVVLDESGIHSLRPLPSAPRRFCIFECIYFSRPDSIHEGASIYERRKRIGAELARENRVEADVVVPVPDSGVPAAIGYSEVSGIPFEIGIIRNHYVGRTFIEPAQQIRNLGVRLKHNANRATLAGKRVVLVDDEHAGGRRTAARAGADHAQQPTDEHRDPHPDQDGDRIGQSPAQVLGGGVENEPHYSRNSRPVSLMNRLSRLGWVRVVSWMSAPTCSRAAKMEGSRRDAPEAASISVVSSALTISMSPILSVARRAESTSKLPCKRSTSRSPIIDRNSPRVPAARILPWSMIANRSHRSCASCK